MRRLFWLADAGAGSLLRGSAGVAATDDAAVPETTAMQQPARTSADDQDDGAVVTQGVQFPGVDRDSKLGKATSDNATCTDCEWTVSPACIANGPEDDALCLGATIGCQPPALLMRVYMRHGASRGS